MISDVQISFGMIVLNGEPFLKYNLRALYPFACEIIVVEGASIAAASIASEEGHSTDSTLEVLRNFKEQEDPQDKITIVTAEDEGHSNGFWPGEKHEQSKAYARRASGNYLWQVDVDEFYTREGMKAVVEYLQKNPDTTAMSFEMLTFWGNPQTRVDGWYLRRGANIYHRLFKWGPGYSYTTHRPPTVINALGEDTRSISHVDGKQSARLGAYLYHYSLLFPKQVNEKSKYYQHASWVARDAAVEWADSCYHKLERPFRVHNVYTSPSWLETYGGEHPVQIIKMWQAILEGEIQIERKDMHAAERLLHSIWYRIGREIYKRTDYIFRPFIALRRFTFRIKRYLIRISGFVFEKANREDIAHK